MAKCHKNRCVCGSQELKEKILISCLFFSAFELAKRRMRLIKKI